MVEGVGGVVARVPGGLGGGGGAGELGVPGEVRGARPGGHRVALVRSEKGALCVSSGIMRNNGGSSLFVVAWWC